MNDAGTIFGMDLGKLGERVTAARKALGLSQQRLAELSGLSLSAIRRLEYGEQKPSIVHVARVASVLGTTLDGLASGLTRAPDDAPPELIEAFRSRPLGVTATADEMQLIRAAAANAPGTPTLAFLEALLALSRGLISQGELAGAAALSDDIDSGKWKPR